VITIRRGKVEKIFEKSCRCTVSNGSIGGADIDMTIRKQIIESLGGQTWVRSEYNKGITVRFAVPITVSRAAEEGGRIEKDPHSR
jgi:signal transduction histidine kinase